MGSWKLVKAGALWDLVISTSVKKETEYFWPKIKFCE